MIKNIILDVGGIILDDSKVNIERLLNKDCSLIYKTAYSGGFRECLLGNKTMEEHIKNLSNQKDFKDISYILKKENLSKSCPLIKENFEYIKKLKEKGYKLYLLTNITEDTHVYLDNLVDISQNFDGGIYSYQDHLIKPDPNIYKLIIEKFGLNKEETIFFDDKEKNVIAARKVGIKAVVFNSIEDIKNNIEL